MVAQIATDSFSRLFTSRVLLQFIDHFEKQIHQSYEANVKMSQNQRNSATFFKTNRKVCIDWFAKMRQSLLLASGSVGTNSTTIAFYTSFLIKSHYFSLFLAYIRFKLARRESVLQQI